MLATSLSSGPGDNGYLPVVGRVRRELEDNKTRLSMAVPEYEYPGSSLGGCQALYDLWVEFNISASATTQTTCDPVNQYNGLQTKTVLQSICARQARVECLILDSHVSIQESDR